LSELSKMDVIDKTGTKIGRINDVAFFDDDCLSFIIGGSATEEFLEKIGVIDDVDLIVPRQNITSVQDNKIMVNLTRDELTTTLAGDIKKGTDLKNQSYVDSRKKVSLVSKQSLLL
ncbi:MAG: PRC-barrel domain-containing protein, partial [Candidatus Hodarchaeales archaeon]